MNKENLGKKPWYQKWWGVIFASIGGGLLVIVIIFVIMVVYYYYQIKAGKFVPLAFNNTGQVATSDQSFNKLLIPLGSPTIGGANAKVVIVEFSDFNCPASKEAYSVVREIADEYKDKIQVVYRDFPAQQGSDILALVGRCANEQNKFWPIYDKLFQNQGQTSLANLVSYANQVGLDIKQFSQCLADKKYQAVMEQDLRDGATLGVSKTPTFFINGNKVEGAIPKATFEKIIDGILEKLK